MPLSKEKDKLRKRRRREVQTTVQPKSNLKIKGNVQPVVQPDYSKSFHPCPKKGVR